MRKFFAAFVFIASFHALHAQTLSNLRVKNIPVRADTVRLDSASISPNSAFLLDNENHFIDSSAYQIDFAQGIFIWRKNSEAYKQIKKDSMAIHYRVFPFLFSQSYKHKDINKITRAREEGVNPFSYNPNQGEATFFKYEGLNKSGSISRGITFGNNQDVYVNSSLNLQLAGRLNDNVNILAAITDENVPLQPEGNTQQLQDFDKVFIQLYNDRTKLIAGDFELKRPDSYFMNFYKKAQGA